MDRRVAGTDNNLFKKVTMKESVMPVPSTVQARGGIHCLEVMSTVDSGLRRNDKE